MKKNKRKITSHYFQLMKELTCLAVLPQNWLFYKLGDTLQFPEDLMAAYPIKGDRAWT